MYQEDNLDESNYRYGYRIGFQKVIYPLKFVNEDIRAHLDKKELPFFNRGFQDGRKAVYGNCFEVNLFRDAMSEEERCATREDRARPMPLERVREKYYD